MVSLASEMRSISDRAMRQALSARLAAWADMDLYRRPIRAYSPDVRRRIEAASDRFRSAKLTLVIGLWQRRGRWADPANPVELVLDADGDGFLILAPGVMAPPRRLLRAAERANAGRFGSVA